MKKFRNILLVIIGVSFIISGIQITRRVMKEQRNKNVEIVADLTDFENLAIEMNVPIEEVAKKLVGADTTSIAISEEILNDMNKKLISLFAALSLLTGFSACILFLNFQFCSFLPIFFM